MWRLDIYSHWPESILLSLRPSSPKGTEMCQRIGKLQMPAPLPGASATLRPTSSRCCCHARKGVNKKIPSLPMSHQQILMTKLMNLCHFGIFPPLPPSIGVQAYCQLRASNETATHVDPGWMPGEIMSLVTKFNLDDRWPHFGDGSSGSRVDVSATAKAM